MQAEYVAVETVRQDKELHMCYLMIDFIEDVTLVIDGDSCDVEDTLRSIPN